METITINGKLDNTISTGTKSGDFSYTLEVTGSIDIAFIDGVDNINNTDIPEDIMLRIFHDKIAWVNADDMPKNSVIEIGSFDYTNAKLALESFGIMKEITEIKNQILYPLIDDLKKANITINTTGKSLLGNEKKNLHTYIYSIFSWSNTLPDLVDHLDEGTTIDDANLFSILFKNKDQVEFENLFNEMKALSNRYDVCLKHTRKAMQINSKAAYNLKNPNEPIL